MGNGKFYLYSAHYPTLLGILGALGKTPIDKTEVLPSYTSALIFEYHVNDDDGTDEIHLYYRRGQAAENDPTEDKPVFQVTNFCGSAASSSASNSTSCSLENLWNMLDGWTVQQWCTECENDNADVCKQQIYNDALASMGSTSDCNTTTASSNKNGKDFVGWALFITLAVIVVIGGVFYWLKKPNGGANRTLVVNTTRGSSTRMIPIPITTTTTNGGTIHNNNNNDDNEIAVVVQVPPTKDDDDLASMASTECSF
jgi:hypothetical protein